MADPREIQFDLLHESNLLIDCVYRGGTKGHQGDDPLHPLLGVGNAGGFRPVGKGATSYAAIFSTGAEVDWRDRFTNSGATFVYYGDQRTPGSDLLETPRGGNRLLTEVFEKASRDSAYDRAQIPPLFLFRKTGSGRDVTFGGLLVPRASSARRSSGGLVIRSTETPGGTVLNYEATFAVLRPPVIDRAWFDDLRAGRPMTRNGPAEWFKWVAIGA
jgi:hypothetical protein